MPKNTTQKAKKDFDKTFLRIENTQGNLFALFQNKEGEILRMDQLEISIQFQEIQTQLIKTRIPTQTRKMLEIQHDTLKMAKEAIKKAKTIWPIP